MSSEKTTNAAPVHGIVIRLSGCDMITEVVRAMHERVGAGLRRLKREPDALVFVDDMLGVTWDKPMACGITVFHGTGFLPPCHGSTEPDCPFFPVWADDYPDAWVETKRFVDGYCDG